MLIWRLSFHFVHWQKMLQSLITVVIFFIFQTYIFNTFTD